MNLLRQEQAFFDRIEFDKDERRHLDEVERKRRHVSEHLGKIIGVKLAPWIIGNVDDVPRLTVVGQVLPDLLIYRTQLISTLNDPVDSLPPALFEPVPQHRGLPYYRLAYLYAAQASGQLATYFEELDHRYVSGEDPVLTAAGNIHRSAMMIAEEYGITPSYLEGIHMRRMALNCNMLHKEFTAQFEASPEFTTDA